MILGIDANSIIHRAYHAYPSTIITSQGVLVNAAYGFTSMFLDVLSKYKPKYVFCAFDSKEPTVRHQQFADYKAHRPKSDSDLADQFPAVKEILNSLNVPIFEIPGYEADDILGAIAYRVSMGKNYVKFIKYNKDKGHKDYSDYWQKITPTKEVKKLGGMLIVSGDKDLLQLVNRFNRVVLPKGSFKNLVEYDEKGVEKLMGIKASQIVDYKAMVGDPSDNIPGVKGLGPKSAVDLLVEYGSLEEIYKHLDKIGEDKKRVANLLQEGEELAWQSQELAQIMVDVPLVFSLKQAKLKDFDEAKALEVFGKYEFRSLVKKLGEATSKKLEIGNKKLGIKKGKLGLEPSKLKNLSDKGICSQAELKGLEKLKFKAYKQFSVKDSELVAFLKGGKKLEGNKNDVYIAIYDEKQTVLDIFQAKLKEKSKIVPSVIFYGWEAFTREIVKYRPDFCIEVEKRKILDVSLLAYLVRSGRRSYNLADLITSELNDVQLHQRFEDGKVAKKEWPDIIFKVYLSLLEASLYSQNENLAKRWEKVARVCNFTNPALKLLYSADIPLALALARMSQNGILVNLDKVKEFEERLAKRIDQLEKDIYKEVGHEFNVRSSQQLGKVLFEELGLPTKKKTKTGFSTDDTVLHDLLPAHPVIKMILEYREVHKLYSTYVKPFIKMESKAKELSEKRDLFGNGQEYEGGNYIRVHSQFIQTASSTGRLASRNPNLQNLPTRTELGRHIKSFFEAGPGKVLIALDYSQIDLRVIADMSGDQQLISDFKKGLDIHQATAAKIFKSDYKKVDKNQRRIAKIINFGVLYGMSPYGLARALDIRMEEAKDYIDSYFSNYSGVRRYIDEVVELVKEQGYVVSLLGRRNFVAGVTARNPIRQRAALRQAVNMPIQGGTDDIMRLAMVGIDNYLIKDEKKDIGHKVRLVLQVHDEFVLEVEDEASLVKKVRQDVEKIMSGVIELKVPLVVASQAGKSLEEL